MAKFFKVVGYTIGVIFKTLTFANPIQDNVSKFQADHEQQDKH